MGKHWLPLYYFTTYLCNCSLKHITSLHTCVTAAWSHFCFSLTIVLERWFSGNTVEAVSNWPRRTLASFRGLYNIHHCAAFVTYSMESVLQVTNAAETWEQGYRVHKVAMMDYSTSSPCHSLPCSEGAHRAPVWNSVRQLLLCWGRSYHAQ